MQRNHGLDFIKTICAFMIVCIHVPFPGMVGTIVTPLTRIAVPLFFMITGYYYSRTKERRQEKKQLLKILSLFAGANLLFFAWSLLIAVASGNSPVAALGRMFHVQALLKFVLLNESPFGEHLWYLGAILYVLLMVLLFEKKWSRAKLYPMIPVLLLADLVFGKYSLVLFHRTFPYIFVRNFLCVGLPYFLIGDWIYTRKLSVKPGKAGLLVTVFALTTLAERFLLGALSVNAARDHYISTTFLAVSVFLLAVQHESGCENKALSLLCHIGAKLATGIYILHPMIVVVLAKLVSYCARYLPQLSIVYSCLAPFVVFALAVAASWLLYVITRKIRRKQY